MGKYGKRKRVSVDLLSYNLMLIGEGGIGKTTVINEYCRKLAGEDGYMFLTMGHEDGDGAIDNIPSETIEDFEKFVDVIDDIVENKSTEYPDLRVVVVDTYDELVAITEPEVVRLHNIDNPDKPIRSIKAAFGGLTVFAA